MTDVKTEQVEIPSDKEMEELDLSFCKITDITPNSGGEKEKGASARINLSVNLNPLNRDMVKSIAPKEIIEILNLFEGEPVPFKQIMFDIPGGANVNLELFEGITDGDRFLNRAVTLNKGARMKAADGAIYLQVSFTVSLGEVNINLLYAVFDLPIFCRIFQPQMEAELK